MKGKKIFIGLSILAIVFICYGIFKLVTFNLFDNDSVVLEDIKIKDKDYSLKIYYVPSDATIQSSIQIRKVRGDIEEVLKDYERYNFLESHEINNDSLFIVVNDTMRTRVKAKKFGIKLPGNGSD